MTADIQWSNNAHRANGFGNTKDETEQFVPSSEGYIDTALWVASNCKDHPDDVLAKAARVLRAQKMPGMARDVERVIAERKEHATSS